VYRRSASALIRVFSWAVLLCLAGGVLPNAETAPLRTIIRFPAHGAVNVNPDTHLEMSFPETPLLGSSGQIRIYSAEDDRLVDALDLSIPPGPTAPTPSPSET
jgi:hypothetical protein